jgi:hypothetical protein
VDAFLSKVAAAPKPPSAGGEHGRLIFAMDATASREPTWDQALHIQAQMFSETAALGGLAVQLCHYRGFQEFQASDWLLDTKALRARMTAVRCLGGHTQIERVLRHALAETRRKKVNALVFVGDCLEEPVDPLCQLAGELGLLGLPVFLFHEGGEAHAASAFRQIARLSGGAYSPFDSGSAQQLRELLSAVAVFAAGGRPALEQYGRKGGKAVKLLTQQLGKR